MGSSPEDLFHVAQDEDYLLRLRAEQEYWDKRVETPRPRTAPEAVKRYYNERMTGDSDRQWFETISDYGEFRQGRVLGAGPGHVESHLLSRHDDLHLTIYDVSGDALARLRSRLDGEFPGRAKTRQEDLNFATLPTESCDLLVADSSVHHIVNLEHLAFEANRCLTPDGYFFMHEVVSESCFQFSEEKKRLFQALVNATAAGPTPSSAVRWPDLDNWPSSPFESVRSGEILDVFGHYLQEVHLRTAGALLTLGLIARPGTGPCPEHSSESRIPSQLRRAGATLLAKLRRRTADVARTEARLRLLLTVDRMVSDTGYLQPGVAFAIYRKRG